jgi:hypothetical protein
MRVKVFHGGAAARARELATVQEKGGVCLTTYGTVRTSAGALSDHGRYTWDYCILDEGHLVKNVAAQGSQALRAIPARHRLMLTGTPLQNNLKELWALFDYVCDGLLLGTYRQFKHDYEDHILRVRHVTDRQHPPALTLQSASAYVCVCVDIGKRQERAGTGAGARPPGDRVPAPAAAPALSPPREAHRLWSGSSRQRCCARRARRRRSV